MIRVLGIDPGSRATGYGVVEMHGSRLVHVDHGTLCGAPDASLGARLLAVYRGLRQVIEVHAPQEVGIESIFHARNSQSALKLGHVRGVALLTAEMGGVPIVEYTPMQVKSAVVGYGKAEKHQVQEMVRRLLALPRCAGQDASDALAVAICHLQTRRTLAAVGRGTAVRP